MQNKRKIIVTAGLPYANGDIHIGHLVEYIQTDIFVRFHKLVGNECLYLCGDDTHGTPIMISARKLGISPEELIKKMHAEHLKDFSNFYIAFDNYYTTHSDENREFAEFIYNQMRKQNLIVEKTIEQLYCEHDKMFLPDRFIKGKCPKCNALDQYGDSCDVCSATYSPIDVIDPYCSICKNKPVMKSSIHYFFALSKLTDMMKEWISSGKLQAEVENKINEWFKEGLRDWDISRDEPYFGFKIPGTTDKYFYVWLDAPIGYMASLKNWCTKNGKKFEDYWQDPESEIYHFIGKDILYFHTLFWPAMLKVAGFKTPTKVFVHGMLKVDNERMSKSRGTFINAKTYLKYLHPEYLRYYYASKLSYTIDDINLSLNDFIYKVNSELVGNITNILSRTCSILNKNFDNVIVQMDDEGKLVFENCINIENEIKNNYENRDFAQVISNVIKLSDSINKFIDNKKPWALVKENKDECHKVLSSVINCFKVLMIYLKPILPNYVLNVEKILNVSELKWNDIKNVLVNHRINEFKPLITRIEPEKVEQMINESKEVQQVFKGEVKQDNNNNNTQSENSQSSEITIEDFQKIDLRVARVIDVLDVEGSDKLYQVLVSLGDTQKTVFAGIKKYVKKEELIGKLIILVNNLKPRKMKFGTSYGMILAASDDNNLTFLTVASDIKEGAKVS